MKSNLLLVPFLLVLLLSFNPAKPPASTLFKASDKNISYMGRIDFSRPDTARFWAPGVAIKAKFKGIFCEILINDEVLWGNSHNYISISIDGGALKRIKLEDKNNVIMAGENLRDTIHEVTICKLTESNIGYLDFVGLRCEALLPANPSNKRKMEFIGDSITCGMGCDETEIPCDSGVWYDQHNAYLSYGATTARNLNADWHLTAVSGIGLVKSCCDLKLTMPDVFDKISLSENALDWDFSKYQPDVVAVCLGQNDGIQEERIFTQAYTTFVKRLRVYYPKATIVLLTSPMADKALLKAQRAYLKSVKASARARGDRDVHTYAYGKRYHQGCGDHPSLEDQQLMAAELTAFVKKIKEW